MKAIIQAVPRLALAIGLIAGLGSAHASVLTNGSLHFELGECTDNPRSSITEVKWSDAKPIAGSDKRSITICVRASESIKQFGFTYSTPSFYGPGKDDIVVKASSTIGYLTSDNVTIEFPQRGGWSLSINGESGRDTGGSAPIEYDFTNVKATLIYDHRFEKTIKHVPDQLSADGLLRLLVFLDRPLSDERYADTDSINVTATKIGSDNDDIKIVTDPSPMRFDKDNDYGVVIVSGETDAAKREIASGNISIKLAAPDPIDYPKQGWTTSYVVKPATVEITEPPMPLCAELPDDSDKECAMSRAVLSSQERAAAFGGQISKRYLIDGFGQIGYAVPYLSEPDSGFEWQLRGRFYCTEDDSEVPEDCQAFAISDAAKAWLLRSRHEPRFGNPDFGVWCSGASSLLEDDEGKVLTSVAAGDSISFSNRITALMTRTAPGMRCNASSSRPFVLTLEVVRAKK